MAKMNVGMALVQGQMLARLHGKGSRYGYVAKNSWNDCVEKISVGIAWLPRKACCITKTNNNKIFSEKKKSHDTFEKKKKISKERELQF